jgi:hypothetical protein
MKPIDLKGANGLQLSSFETVKLLVLLGRIGMDGVDPTPADRAFARDVLLRTALLYPEYAEQVPKPSPIRPSLSPLRHNKKGRK